jgi:hypothetical protein
MADSFVTHMKRPRWILAAAIRRPLCLVPAAYYYTSGMTKLALARVLFCLARVIRAMERAV